MVVDGFHTFGLNAYVVHVGVLHKLLVRLNLSLSKLIS